MLHFFLNVTMNMKCNLQNGGIDIPTVAELTPQAIRLFGSPSGELGLGVNPRIIVDLPGKHG